jgi:uncharacterized glyoxalase superfamily protein PhnB
MPQNIVPMIAYEDAPAAMNWLVRAFGFREVMRITAPDGRVEHGELELSGEKVMVATPTPDYRSPAHHAEECEAASRWLAVPYVVDGVLVYVDDVDNHFTRAKVEGAQILSEVEDSPPGRLYRVADIEGHRWMFIQRP